MDKARKIKRSDLFHPTLYYVLIFSTAFTPAVLHVIASNVGAQMIRSGSQRVASQAGGALVEYSL